MLLKLKGVCIILWMCIHFSLWNRFRNQWEYSISTAYEFYCKDDAVATHILEQCFSTGGLQAVPKGSAS
jgi:hypothetical protein